MTNWQQIAEELREAARNIEAAGYAIPNQFALQRTDIHRLGDETERLAQWAAEQADVANTEARDYGES